MLTIPALRLTGSTSHTWPGILSGLRRSPAGTDDGLPAMEFFV